MPRPYVILNAAMTIDGKIATAAGDSNISSEVDLDRLHGLRANVDAVMVGAGTVIADNPSLTVRRIKGKNPVRVVIDGQARTPVNARVLDDSAKTIVAVTKAAKKQDVDKLRAAGADVIIYSEDRVNLRALLEELYSRGVRKLLLEGGSNLNWNMLVNDLVDELRVAVAHKIVGGERAKTLVGGTGFAKVRDGVKLKLAELKHQGSETLLIYKVVGVGRD